MLEVWGWVVLGSEGVLLPHPMQVELCRQNQLCPGPGGPSWPAPSLLVV